MPTAGDDINASDFSQEVIPDSSVGSIWPNFSLVSATVRTSLFGRLVDFRLEVTSTNAITATSGNIGDPQCFALDSDYWPSEIRNTVIGSGVATGEAQLGTNGAVLLRSMSDSIGAGANLRMNFLYLRD